MCHNRRDFLKIGCLASIAPIINLEKLVDEDFPQNTRAELERIKKIWLGGKYKVLFIISKDWKTTSQQFMGYHDVKTFITEFCKDGHFPFAILEPNLQVRRLDILKTYEGVQNEKVREKNLISSVIFLDKTPTNFMLSKYLNNVFVI